jgi:FkbM family methyltransferase
MSVLRDIKSNLKKIPLAKELWRFIKYWVFEPGQRDLNNLIKTAWPIAKSNGFTLPIMFSKDGPFIVTDDNLFFAFNQNDWGGGCQNIYRNGLWEKSETQLITQHLSEDAVFFDIGANIGYFTVAVGCSFNNIKIICCEPGPSTFQFTRLNVQRNRLTDKVELIQAAIADKAGETYMSSSLGNLNYMQKHKSENAVKVPCLTVDQIVSEQSLSRVDFIKCDVEGAELLMLKGAQETIKRFKPFLLLEIENRWTTRFGYEPKAIFEILQPNYEYYPVTPEGVISSANMPLEECIDRMKCNNFFFVEKGAPCFV